MTDEEKNEMFIRNKKLIYLAMKQLNILSIENEIYDIGLIGMTRGINNYNKNLGYKESTFLYRCIYYELLKYLKCNCNRDIFKKKIISIDKNISSDTTLGDFIIDNKINFEKEIENKDYEDYLYKYILKLKPSHQEVLCKYYGIKQEQKNVPQIAKEKGVSKQCIQERIKSALKQLRKRMEKDYENKSR